MGFPLADFKIELPKVSAAERFLALIHQLFRMEFDIY